MKALDIAEYSKDERFISEKNSKKHIKDLIEILDGAFKKFDRYEAARRLKNADIACRMVQHIEDIHKDPQALVNDYVIKVKNRDGSEYYTAMTPVRFGSEEITLKSDAPLLGQHNDEILLELGYSEEEIKNMYERNIIHM